MTPDNDPSVDPPERLAVCQAPDGPGDYVPLKPGEWAPTTCFMDCPCTPVVYVRADLANA